jgi:hypothetical protein
VHLSMLLKWGEKKKLPHFNLNLCIFTWINVFLDNYLTRWKEYAHCQSRFKIWSKPNSQYIHVKHLYFSKNTLNYLNLFELCFYVKNFKLVDL